MNNKGQFSIITALLVAVVLVAAVMTTYSSIRYSDAPEQPQILSSIDETDLGLKEILGFTVGYYGSVLKVTGNMTYAQHLATNYLRSGLNNMGDIRREWGAVFDLKNLTLSASWFSNHSYSAGSLTVNYNLTGLGVYGASYNTSTRLGVEILNSTLATQAQLVILRDDNEPLINLGKSNLKLYRYDYTASTWNITEPTSIASYANGTYVLDLPQGIAANSYVIQIDDNRGLMVLAASFTQFTSTLTWNSTVFRQEFESVNEAIDIVGTHSDFAAQQNAPDNVYDTLTEQAFGLGAFKYNPLSLNLLGQTTVAQSSGNVTTDTASDDSNYLWLHSYPSAFSGTANVGYTTAETASQSIDNYIRGSVFTVGNGGQAESISAYLKVISRSATVKAAIYTTSRILVGSTPEQTVSVTAGAWVTFNFAAKPMLNANTNYIFVVWGKAGTGGSSDVLICETTVTNQGYADGRAYTANWPSPDSNLNNNNYKYSIYCTYSLATQYTTQVEFSGTSDTINWQQLTWAVDSAVTAGTASCTLQLFNANVGAYPSSGDGYLNTSLTTIDSMQTQAITINPTYYRNASTGWKLLVTSQNTTASQFDLKIDLARFTALFTNYALNLQEQWLNVNTSIVRQDLCIKTGDLGAEPLVVQILHEGSWLNLVQVIPNYFNNISVTRYIDSSNLTIRFVGANDLTDPTLDTYNIDCVYLKDEPDIAHLVKLQESTFTLEMLQNGTMRWLGQNMTTTTHTIPIPPLPVKAIHVNQTINGVNRQVPFQIEDWASNYQIPLGLTSNTTVFSNRQMIVFNLNSSISDFTVWWDGSDSATQTSMAYRNNYFIDNVAGTLNNGMMQLQFSSNGCTLPSKVGSTTTTANLMRLNGNNDGTASELSYIIQNGTIRDIVLGEAEYSSGVPTSPNTYTNIVVTLPAGATYYTYQVRYMFLDTTRTRSISDLCPVRVSTSASFPTPQTENDLLAGFPILENGQAAYLNYAPVGWTPHHFSQLITNDGKGSGIMFTDLSNQRLYNFDAFSGSTSKGALKTSSNLLEMLPVSSSQVSFKYAYDITWVGAVATFDATTPICNFYDATTPMGLWILAECPPTLTITPKS
jgi:hypothetical protein